MSQSAKPLHPEVRDLFDHLAPTVVWIYRVNRTLSHTLTWFHAHVTAVLRSVGAPARLLPPLTAAIISCAMPRARSVARGRWDGTHSGARHIAPDIP
jgi:hypothetical protein